jgi:hypothetical protein
VDFDLWIERSELSLVGFKVLASEVTDIDSTGAVVRELVGCSSAYADGRVCAYKFSWLVTGLAM